MASPVKTPSRYRREQAAATRQRIAEAARRLFGRRGYGTTSMEAIAAEAGVGVRTVYAVFGTKRDILSEICERWLETARARERVGEVLAEPDPLRRVRAAAAWLANLYAAGFDVVLIFDAAMDESPQTQALLRSKLAGRDQAMNAMIASVEDVLRVPLAEAQAVYRALAAPGVYGELVQDFGWSPERFADWVGDALERHLLGPAGERSEKDDEERRGPPGRRDGH